MHKDARHKLIRDFLHLRPFHLGCLIVERAQNLNAPIRKFPRLLLQNIDLDKYRDDRCGGTLLCEL